MFKSEADRRTRGHNFELKRRHSRLNIRKFSFANKIFSPWNDLAENVFNAKSVNSFKSKLNDYWKNKDIKFNQSCYTVGAGSDKILFKSVAESMTKKTSRISNQVISKIEVPRDVRLG